MTLTSLGEGVLLLALSNRQALNRVEEDKARMGEGVRDEKVASSNRKTKFKTTVQKSIPYL